MTLHLALGIPDTIIGWQHPDSEVDRLGTLSHVIDIAAQAEAAALDAVFRADSPVLGIQAHRGGVWPGLEPFTLAAAIIAHTTHLGVIATASTTFNEPYHLARVVASLAQLSGNRVAWNAVTSAAGERNFGRALPPQPERYERAAEFIDVTRALWRSWPPGAPIVERAAGRHGDPESVRAIDHRGTHFQVAGPLDVRGTPGDEPVIVQAGGAPYGRDLGASRADVIYTVSPSLDEGIAFAHDIRRRSAIVRGGAAGPALLVGALLVIGENRAEAERLDRELRAGVDLAAGRAALAAAMGGVDLDGLDLDQPVPEDRLVVDIAALPRRQSRPALFLQHARNGASLRELIELETLSGGVLRLVGTPADVADAFERWHRSGAADGFVVFPSHLPRGRDLFLGPVVTELRRRGLFRERYAETSLRARFATGRPPATSLDGKAYA